MITAADGNRIQRRKRQQIEVKLIVELQLPAWLQQLQPGPITVPVSVPVPAMRPEMNAAERRNAAPVSDIQEESKVVPTQDRTGAAFVATTSETSSAVVTTTSDSRLQEPLEPSGLTFEDAFRIHVFPEIALENGSKSQAEYRTSVRQFVEWFKTHHRLTGPMVADLCQQSNLLGEFYSFLLQNGAEGTATNKLKCLRRIWKDLHELEIVNRAPVKARTKQIRKKLGVDKASHVPLPVTQDDLSRCFTAILELDDRLTFPRLGSIEPFQFWWNVFAICAVHGIRPADFWPLESKDGFGLEWSEVSLSEHPPIRKGETIDASWEFGWLCLKMNKTGGWLRTPMSPHLRWLIEQCRGLDDRRVFPLTYDRQQWYKNVGRIFSAAGFQKLKLEENSQRSHWPISLCGAAPQASLRKSASVLWRQCGSSKLSSFMLGHSSRTGTAADVEEGSAITEDHYSGSVTFSEVVKAFPKVLAALPELIRC